MKRLIHLLLVASMAFAPINAGFAYVSADSDMHGAKPCPDCDHARMHDGAANSPCGDMHCDLDGCTAAGSLTYIEPAALDHQIRFAKPVYPHSADTSFGTLTTPPLFRPPIA